MNYNIINSTVNDTLLREFLRENDIELNIIDESSRWTAFCIYYGKTHGLNDIHATSFGCIISSLFTNTGVCAGTDNFIKEESLEEDIKEWILTNNPDETEIFHHIFKIYSEDIFEYEYKTERLNIRLTLSQLERFHQVTGNNNNQKFENLLKTYHR